jgi:hypothetical protein
MFWFSFLEVYFIWSDHIHPYNQTLEQNSTLDLGLKLALDFSFSKFLGVF